MDNLAGLRINSHDIEFLAAVGRYSLLAFDDARQMYPSLKPNSVQRRLRLLVENALVQRIKLTVWWAADDKSEKGGRIPTLYALTDDGARMIADCTGDRTLRVLRSAPSPATFLHRSEIVRVMRAFDAGCQGAGLALPQWIMEQDPWPGAPKSGSPSQRRYLSHEFGDGITCHPDIACRIRIGSIELVLYWEVDLSTEGCKQIRRASKTDGYVVLFNEQGWKRYWPDLETSRRYVIWVAPTQRRIRSLQETLRAAPVAPLCRFLAATNFSLSESLLTAEIWETIDGDRRAIYRPQ